MLFIKNTPKGHKLKIEIKERKSIYKANTNLKERYCRSTDIRNRNISIESKNLYKE